MDNGVSPLKARAAQAAVAQGLLGEERLIAGFVDVAGVRHAVGELRRAFPDHFMHAFAAKAGCLEGILRLVRSEDTMAISRAAITRSRDSAASSIRSPTSCWSRRPC